MDEIILIDKNEICMYTEEQAREMTEAIKYTTNALYALVKKAHDEKIFLALGYKTWGEYIKNEFNFSRGRSYQLISQAEVLEKLELATDGVPVYITEKEARAIKKKLNVITQKIQDGITDGMTDEEKAQYAEDVINQHKEKTQKEDNEENIFIDEEDDFEEELEQARREGYKKGLDEVSDQKYDQTKFDKDGYVKDFYVENLIKLLSIFDSMPDANRLIVLIEKSNVDTETILKSINKTSDYLDVLRNQLNKESI